MDKCWTVGSSNCRYEIIERQLFSQCMDGVQQ